MRNQRLAGAHTITAVGRLFVALIVPIVCVCVVRPVAADQPARAGIGIGGELGHPTGLSIKTAIGSRLQIQGGIGTGLFRGYGLMVHADLLAVPARLAPNTWLYVGGGVRFWDHHFDRQTRYDAGRNTHLGLRIPIGISIQAKPRLELFFEAGVVLDPIVTSSCSALAPAQSATYCRPDSSVDLLASFGLRYVFGTKS